MKRILLTLAFYALILATCFSQVPVKKSIQELVSGNDSGWNKILALKASARNTVEILPKDPKRAEAALIEAQLNTNTFMGAVIYESGGILVDNGWIRILGSGCTRLNRSVPSWNKGKTPTGTKFPYTFMLVADDVLGGMFALKSDGKQSPDSCIVYYYGPNSLKWKATGFNYRTFISYCFSGSVKRFYDDFRWTGWEKEVSQMDGNHVISCFPLLWTKNALEQKSNRKVVTVQKQWEIYPRQTKFTSDQNLMVNN